MLIISIKIEISFLPALSLFIIRTLFLIFKFAYITKISFIWVDKLVTLLNVGLKKTKNLPGLDLQYSSLSSF